MLLAFLKGEQMQSIFKNYKKKYFKKIGALASLLLISQIMACAPGSENKNTSNEELACNSIQNLQTHSSEQAFPQESKSITIDSQIDSYIIEFEDETDLIESGLPPSGKPVHDYIVSGVHLKNVGRNTFSFDIKGDENTKKELIQKIAQERNFKFVEPDYPLFLIPNDEEVNFQNSTDDSNETLSTPQWHHSNIQSQSAWKFTLGSEEIVVAVVDSGIDYRHKDLQSNIWMNSQEIPGNNRDDDENGFVDDIYGWNFVSGNSNPMTTTSSNHGTHVAGIIGASGSTTKGIYGGAQKVKLMALKFIGNDGSGSTSNAIKAIDYAVKKKVFAINNSWGSTSRSQALESAIKRAEKAGVLFIVAAGNGINGTGFDIAQKAYYPAAFTETNIIRVAASKADNNLTKFSNYSKKLVDVAAPGSSILSTVTGNSYMKMSGTSMAAPLVTGLAVLVKSANPSLTYQQVKAIISSSVDPIISLKNKILSGGKINSLKAVSMAANISMDLTGCY